jgi:acetoacetate decarboxylase
MGFLKTPEEIKKFMTMDPKFYQTEVYFCFWQIDKDRYLQLIPPPLEPDEDCPIFVYFVNFPKVEAFGPYKECAIFVGVKYHDRNGLYCLSMPLDNDMAMACGREILGFPKKLAQIEIQNNDDLINTCAKRYGIPFISIIYDFRNQNPETKATAIQNRYFKRDHILFFNFRNFVTIEGVNHFHLIQIMTKIKVQELKQGNAQIEFKPSKTDPWMELKGQTPLGAFYLKGNLEMQPLRIFQEVETEQHTPFAFLGWDW